MFKRVKSLMIAGLLVVGMSGMAFATDGGTGSEGGTGGSTGGVQATIDNIKGKIEETLKPAGADKSGDAYTFGKEDLITSDAWDNFMNGINGTNNADDGIVIEEGSTDGQYIMYFDANFDGVLQNEEKTGDKAVVLATVTVDFAPATGAKGDIEIAPGTGDILVAGGAAVAAVAGGALALVNKKSKKDEE